MKFSLSIGEMKTFIPTLLLASTLAVAKGKAMGQPLSEARPVVAGCARGPCRVPPCRGAQQVPGCRRPHTVLLPRQPGT